jgi:hypothetical protein
MSEKLTTKLIGLIDRELQPSTGSEEDVQMLSTVEESSIVLAKPVWILATYMQALQKRDPTEWATKVDIYKWICSGTKNWGVAPEVVAGLAPLARMRYRFLINWKFSF